MKGSGRHPQIASVGGQKTVTVNTEEMIGDESGKGDGQEVPTVTVVGDGEAEDEGRQA